MKHTAKKVISVLLVMTLLMGSFAVIGFAEDGAGATTGIDLSSIISSIKAVIALLGFSLGDMGSFADQIFNSLGGLSAFYEKIINSLDAAGIIAVLLSLFF